MLSGIAECCGEVVAVIPHEATGVRLGRSWREGAPEGEEVSGVNQ